MVSKPHTHLSSSRSLSLCQKFRYARCSPNLCSTAAAVHKVSIGSFSISILSLLFLRLVVVIQRCVLAYLSASVGCTSSSERETNLRQSRARNAERKTLEQRDEAIYDKHRRDDIQLAWKEEYTLLFPTFLVPWKLSMQKKNCLIQFG